jgi:hypothetical protein
MSINETTAGQPEYNGLLPRPDTTSTSDDAPPSKQSEPRPVGPDMPAGALLPWGPRTPRMRRVGSRRWVMPLYDPIEIHISVERLLTKHGPLSLEQIVEGIATYGGSVVPAHLVSDVISDMNLRLLIDPDGDLWKMPDRPRGFRKHQVVTDHDEPGTEINWAELARLRSARGPE